MAKDNIGTGDTMSWYLAQTKPGHEHIAAEYLTARSFAQVFNPREPRRQVWRGRVQMLLRPLFPGYLFVSPDPDRPAWPAIRYARGVTRIVAFGAQEPSAVPTGVVAALRAGCDADGVLQHDDALRPGDQVRFLTGPFADIVTRIETVTPDQRIGLLLDLMGRSVRVIAKNSDLVRVPAT